MDEDRLERAYTERAYAAVGMAKMALLAGYKAGIGKDSNENWDNEWRTVLYVDTPGGQVSWHIAPKDLHLLKDLPKYEEEWDGTFRSRDGSFLELGWNYRILLNNSLLSCTCGSRDLEVFSNVVECLDCGKRGPDQNKVEYACDWQIAIDDWNKMILKEKYNV